MDFKHNLLLLDLETTGLDASKHEIIQLGALLLDKKTLKEKEVFSSYIKPTGWHRRDKESMKINGIKWEQVKNAPGLKKVLMEFHQAFKLPLTPSYGFDKLTTGIKRGKMPQVMLSYYGGPLDMDFLRAAYHRCGLKWKFDYHFLNLWGVFYFFLAAKNQLKNKKKFTGFSLEDLMRRFNIKSKNRHDALEDCRVEAEIFRKMIRLV